MSTRRSLLHAVVMMSVPLAFAAAQDASGSLRGTVIDSIRHGPLVGATVIALRASTGSGGDSRDYSAITDARGKYTINSLPSGMYMVTVEHPWLDSTGFGVPAQKADLLSQRSATVNLAVPSGATIRATFCTNAARDSSIGLVAGYVKDAHTDRPVEGIRVVVAWNDFDVDRRTGRTTPTQRIAAATTARDGTFRMCGLPVLSTISMQAQFGDHKATGIIEVEVPASGVLVETLRLDPNATGTTALTGTVKREGSPRPIAGAHIHLVGASGDVLTGADGTFHLTEVPLGTQSIEVTALGFYPRRISLDVHAADTAKIAVTMDEAAEVLDSVKIAGKQLTLSREFDERSAHGAGQYITAEMIAKASPLQTAELMQQVSGFYVMSDTVYSSRGITKVRGNDPNHPLNRVCQPTLYVDGGLAAHTMNDIAPSAIYGIEVYASAANVPPKYPSSVCGAIFIWTK